MGKRGTKPKIEEIHLRKNIYGYTHNKDIYKRLEHCIDEEGNVISDNANLLFKEADKEITRICVIASKRNKKKGIKQPYYTSEEGRSLAYWRLLYRGAEELIKYNVEQPPEVLPKDTIRGKPLKQPSWWLHSIADSVREQYLKEQRENTFPMVINVTDSMRFLRNMLNDIEEELNRRDSIKKPKKDITWEEDKVLDDDADLDTEIDAIIEGDIPEPKPEELTPLEKLKNVNKSIDDFFKEKEGLIITPETIAEEIKKSKEKKRTPRTETYREWKKKKSPPVID